MRILVTGGCGFIGSNFVRHLLASDDDVEVTNLDALTYSGNRANLADLEARPATAKRYRFVHGDVTDAEVVAGAVKGQDAIVHFAAETHVDRSIGGAAPFVNTNVVGTQVLLDAGLDAGTARYLQVSTDEVYGSIDAGAFTEDSPLSPNNPYSATKAAADLLVRSYAATHGFPAIVVRSSNNYGPYQFPEKVVPLFVTNLIDGEPVPLYGDGANVRDWIHVEDCARAIGVALRDGTPGGIYNIGPNGGVSNLELTRRILAIFGAGDEMIRHVPDRPGHDRRYAVDASRLRALGWSPRIGLDDGLAATVAWYRENPGWWRGLKERAAEGALPATAAALGPSGASPP